MMGNFEPNENFKYFPYWVAERMNIFWKKSFGDKKPYSEDKIFQDYRFTNVYRVLDRSSQYLLNTVINNGKQYSKRGMAWRIILYKHFNLPGTWDALLERFGDIDLNTPKEDLIEFFRGYSIDNKVYSNAYMITASFMRSAPIICQYRLRAGMPKYESYLELFFKGFLDEGVLDKILNSKTMEQGFNYFKEIVGIADFLAYQLVQDLNYTDIVDWDDNSFCAAGAGTQRGIQRVFDLIGEVDYQEIVKWTHSNFDKIMEEYGYDFISLGNHKPTVADISNCFCEVDKYMRGIGIKTEGIKGGRIKQKFSENENKIEFVLPKKWKVEI